VKSSRKPISAPGDLGDGNLATREADAEPEIEGIDGHHGPRVVHEHGGYDDELAHPEDPGKEKTGKRCAAQARG